MIALFKRVGTSLTKTTMHTYEKEPLKISEKTHPQQVHDNKANNGNNLLKKLDELDSKSPQSQTQNSLLA
jgi:hypothetical protein